MISKLVNINKGLKSNKIMSNRLLIAITFSILILPLMFAEVETLGTFKVNDCVNLIQTCGNCTYSNISNVLDPDSSTVLSQSVMTKSGNLYNKTFCSTSKVGTYIVNGYSDVDGQVTIWAYDFDITPTGDINNPNFYYLIFIISLGVIIGGFAIKNGWIVVLGSFGLFYLGLYVILYGINGVKDTVYTWGFGIILLALAGYIAIKSAYEMIEDM